MELRLLKCSCHNMQSVNSAFVTRSGLQACDSLNRDRAWAIVRLVSDEVREAAESECGPSDDNGTPLYEPVTIRNFTKMVLIQPSFGHDGELILNLPDSRSMRVPLISRGNANLRCFLWHSMCYGRDQGDDVSLFLTEFLKSKTPLRLVHMGEDQLRPLNIDTKYGSLVKDTDVVSRFSDWSTYTLLSEQSVSWVNNKLPAGTPSSDAQTFRSNIVVDAPFPFWEDSLLECRVLGSDGTSPWKFRFAKHCGRCTLPTVNRHTGKRSRTLEPLRTLKKYRTNYYPHITDPNSPFHTPQAFLSINITIDLNDNDLPIIKVGDVLKPTQTQTPPVMMVGRNNPWGSKYY